MSCVEVNFPPRIKPDLMSLEPEGKYHSIVTGNGPGGVKHVVIIEAKVGCRPYPCCTVENH